MVYVPKNLICILCWTATQRTHLESPATRSPHLRCTFLTTWAAETNLTWYYAIPWWLIVAPIYCNCAVPICPKQPAAPFLMAMSTKLDWTLTTRGFSQEVTKRPTNLSFVLCGDTYIPRVAIVVNLALHDRDGKHIPSFCGNNVDLESLHPFGTCIPLWLVNQPSPNVLPPKK